MSKRWGAREAIARIGVTIIKDSSFETVAASVQSDIDGLTAIGFAPSPEPILCVVDHLASADQAGSKRRFTVVSPVQAT